MEVFGVFMIFIFIAGGLFLLNILTSVWAYRDAIAKGNSKEYAIIVLVGTMFFPILGLIIYLIIRKD